MSGWAQRDPEREPPAIAGRVPPHDLDVEAAVLSACMLSETALDQVVDTLRPEHFYSDANGLVFEACVGLLEAGREVDAVTVASWLRDREHLKRAGGAAYLASLVDATPAVSHVGSHAETVASKWRLRRTIAICQRIAAEGYGDVGDADQFIAEAERSLFEVARSTERSDVELLDAVLDPAIREHELAAESGDRITGVPTGFADLDHKLAGLHRGDLLIVAARPGMGKTSLALNIARTVAGHEEFGAAFFSLEMPKRQVATRIACSEAGVDLGRLRKGQLSVDDWSALRSAQRDLSGLPLWIDDTPAIGLLELRSKLRRVVAELEARGQRLGAAFVDYLQLMRARGRGLNRDQEIGELSRGLKEIAKEFDVPIITLSQLNRSVETRGGVKRPMLSDLRESGNIEQDADAVIFIYRDDYYNPESDNRGVAELIVAKQRNGPTGVVLTRWFSGCARFSTLGRDEYYHVEDRACSY